MNRPDVSLLPERDDRRIAVDLGGSTLRIVECDLEGNVIRHERFVHPQDRFPSLDAALAWFMSELGYRPPIIAVGAAGPIERGRRVKLTNNHDWPAFDADDAEKALSCRFYLVNDLVIAAASIPVLTPKDLDVIKPGVVEPTAPHLVITLSTGVNDALGLPSHVGPMSFLAAESGHTPFAPRSELEADLLRWMWKQGETYVGFEPVISGSNGFRRVFDFVVETQGLKPMPETLAALAERAAGPVITKAGLEQHDPVALKVFEIIGGAIGSYLGSRVVATLATGGVYLVGSVAQNKALMQYFLDHTPFLERFTTAGPYDRLVVNVPIYRILHPEFGLLGAAEIARRLS
jgi:glucokinase